MLCPSPNRRFVPNCDIERAGRSKEKSPPRAFRRTGLTEAMCQQATSHVG